MLGQRTNDAKGNLAVELTGHTALDQRRGWYSRTLQNRVARRWLWPTKPKNSEEVWEHQSPHPRGTYPSIIRTIDPSCSRDCRDSKYSRVLTRTGSSAERDVPCGRHVRDGLKGRSKVGGVKESGIGGDPDITSNCRMNRNLVGRRRAAKSPASLECPASVSGGVKWWTWRAIEGFCVFFVGSNDGPGGKTIDIRKRCGSPRNQYAAGPRSPQDRGSVRRDAHLPACYTIWSTRVWGPGGTRIAWKR